MVESDAWVDFDALVEVMDWGRNTYVVVRLDDRLVSEARCEGTRRVEGTIDDVAVNLGINHAPVLPSAFAYAGQALLRRLGVRTGDVVHCRLRPADPDLVLVDDDIRVALEAAGEWSTFELLAPAKRRQLLRGIEDAKRPETRARRIARLVGLLGVR